MPVDVTLNKAARRRLDELTRVKNKLFSNGLTLVSIDRRFKLAKGTAGNTLREPNEAGEAAIAAALDTEPHLLWPRELQTRAHDGRAPSHAARGSGMISLRDRQCSRRRENHQPPQARPFRSPTIASPMKRDPQAATTPKDRRKLDVTNPFFGPTGGAPRFGEKLIAAVCFGAILLAALFL